MKRKEYIPKILAKLKATDNLRQRAVMRLVIDENIKLNPYTDHLGNWTVGIGHLMNETEIRQHQAKQATGDKRGYTSQQVITHFCSDFVTANVDMTRFLAPMSHEQISQERRAVILCMAFQLGLPRLMGFKNTRAAIHALDWKEAAKEMRDSDWYEQTFDRAQRLVIGMANDKIPFDDTHPESVYWDDEI